MNYLKVTNSGEIDINAISLMGASTKREDSSKIGQFGSGNKYAIAYFLRNNIGLNIFSGIEEIKLGTKEVLLRNEPFEIILVNGKETSLTISLGYEWTCWQAIREILCNAKDEGGYEYEYTDDLIPEKNKTTFFIETTNEVREIIDNYDDYFADKKEVLFECKIGRILKKHSAKTCIYRRGIKAYETEKLSIFDYDIKNFDINEDRLAKYDWQVISALWRLIIMADKPEISRKALHECKNVKYIENVLDDWQLYTMDVSDTFKDVLKEMVVFTEDLAGHLDAEEQKTTTFIPNTVYTYLRNTMPEEITLPESVSGVTDDNNVYVIVETTPEEKKCIEDHLSFLSNTIIEKMYTIRVAEFQKKKVHGTIDRIKKEIIISRNAFDKGNQWVLNVIIEEYVHLKYEVFDKTREMQDTLIDLLINQIKSPLKKEILIDFGEIVRNSPDNDMELLADSYIVYDRIKDE